MAGEKSETKPLVLIRTATPTRVVRASKSGDDILEIMNEQGKTSVLKITDALGIGRDECYVFQDNQCRRTEGTQLRPASVSEPAVSTNKLPGMPRVVRAIPLLTAHHLLS